MTSIRTLLHRLAESNGIAWEDITDDLARDVRAALAGESATPAPITTTPAAGLLPCPFCGSTDLQAVNDVYVRCRACEAFGPDPTDDCDGVARWNTRTPLSDSTPSPTTDPHSGDVSARGEGASARACWDCRHDSYGDGRGFCALVDHRSDVAGWLDDNYFNCEPLPGARNCPGWERRGVSDG